VKPLAEWAAHREAILGELFRRDAFLPKTHNTMPCCESCFKDADIQPSTGEYRCLDCQGSGVVCQKCIVQDHHLLPLHRIQRWNGQFWEKSSLSAAGLTIQLGHDRLSSFCPHPINRRRLLTVMHCNGIHHVEALFCGCTRVEERSFTNQLLRVGWFPASLQRPASAFTFEVLDLFHELSVQGKVSAHDFYRSIVRVSDNTGLVSINRRYDEFLFITRYYRHLLMLKRAGRGHINNGIALTGPGELAVQCSTCPHPGINLPNDWESAGAEDAWLYRLMLAEDANFSHKEKFRFGGIHRDIDFAPGWTFFPCDRLFKLFLLGYPATQEKNKCKSNFQAIEKADTMLNKGYSATGIGTVVCGRTGMVLPRGVTNLQKGERYVNMDFALFASLWGSRVKQVGLSYDIACMWHVNLRLREEHYPPCMRLGLMNLKFYFFIPKFHILAHGEECQSKYSLNRRPHTARFDGEIIERHWANSNAAGPSTAEMTPNARRETLEDMWNSSNFHKIVNMGSSCLKKLEEALPMREKHEQAFKEFSLTFSRETIDKWTKTIVEWEADPDSVPDPFIVTTSMSSAATNLATVRQELAASDEREAAQGNTPYPSLYVGAFLELGMQLEEQHNVTLIESCRTVLQGLKKSDKDDDVSADIIEKRRLYRPRLQKFRAAQAVYMPGSQAILEDSPDTSNVEDELILLPSSLTAPVRSTACLPNLPQKELQLRVAQGHAALDTLRKLLRVQSDYTLHRRQNIHGQRALTQSHHVLAAFEKKITRAAERYRAAYKAILSLDNRASHYLAEHGFQTLKKQDVKGPRVDTTFDKQSSSARRRVPTEHLGEGYRDLTWIWKQSGGNHALDASDEEYVESMRSEWMKSRARAGRWGEEVRQVVEDMRRCLKYHTWKAGWWRERRSLRTHDGIGAKQRETSEAVRAGLLAYAEKQARMWEAMAMRFAGMWQPLLWKGKYSFDDWSEAHRHAPAYFPDTRARKRFEALSDVPLITPSPPAPSSVAVHPPAAAIASTSSISHSHPSRTTASSVTPAALTSTPSSSVPPSGEGRDGLSDDDDIYAEDSSDDDDDEY
ncbi:hypothetical protein SISNIDRAFT_410793, partial [Sistotremastrum niveocremeum HHB9708]